MRISLISYGSEGDVRPVVALAAGLARAGHDVSMLLDRAFVPLAERHGVRYGELPGDVRAAVLTPEAADLFRKGTNPATMTRMLVTIARSHAEDWTRAMLEASEGADAIIGVGLGYYVAYSVAEKLGIPVIGGSLIPLGPTRAFPPPLFPPPRLRLPGAVNLMLHWAMLQLVWLGFRPMTNRARRDVLGLPPLPMAGVGKELLRRRWPMLYGFSPSLMPPPADWPDFFRVTGAWRLPDGPLWEAPRDLTDFLDAGEAPVYVGFGSMGGYDPAETTELVLTALDGRRAVLAAGWGGLDRGAGLPATVHVLESAPHDWLLPQMTAAVHHGGAGTTHAAAAAGIPSVVVPFLGDQPFWGARLHALGVAPPPIPRRYVTAAALADALKAAESPPVRRAAAALGRRVAAEDGVRSAVELLEAAHGRGWRAP